jgi:sigma-E factor negative regulatory protein RseC
VCKTIEGGAEIEAINEANAHAGDTVRVIFKPYTYLKGTILIYGIPALMLIIGAIVGKEFVSKSLPDMDPDIVSAISGLGLFLVSFFCIKFFAKRFEGKKEYMPVISEIVSSKQ